MDTEKKPDITREQLQMNIEVSTKWLQAIKSGNYPGEQIPYVAGLINFLANENKKSVDEYEALSLKHPELEKPKAAATVQ